MKLENLAGIFKALSEETRLKILYLLETRSLCVCEIMGALEITQTKASRHLIYLKNSGLLTSKKEDRWVLYEIRPDLPTALRDLLKKARSLVEQTGELAEVEKRLDVILRRESIYRQVHGVRERDGSLSGAACKA